MNAKSTLRISQLQKRMLPLAVPTTKMRDPLQKQRRRLSLLKKGSGRPLRDSGLLDLDLKTDEYESLIRCSCDQQKKA
jgi:hypothetical protein